MRRALCFARQCLRHWPLHLALEDGALELDGAVPSLAAKRRAVQLAASHPEVHSVTDRLRVIPSAGMTDATICDHVERARRTTTRSPRRFVCPLVWSEQEI